MNEKVVYVNFHLKTVETMEEMKQMTRQPRKKLQEYRAMDYMNEAKLMVAKCKEVMEEFLGWSDELEA
ncbi:MAG: hypothetical protein ACI35O_12470 [Bacillaceae bacterium]